MNNILKYRIICPQSSGSMSLEVANRMYIQASFNVLKDFRRTVRKTFGSDTKGVNFVTNHEKARRIINTWVEKRTRDKIKQIIGPGNHVSHYICLRIDDLINEFCDPQSQSSS
jgi:serine protease inhibitor